MSEKAGSRLKLPLSEVVAALLVSAGILLWLLVSRRFLVLAGLGAFGPGLLREFGWLRDQDEFQRQAAYRAGYHAYLVGGLAAVLVLTGVEWGGEAVGASSEWLRLVLVVLWLTWLSSTLLTYWGARTTAARVLRVFGSFWAVFVIADLVSEAITPRNRGSPVQMLLGAATALLLVAPFFGLAWTARRWPRRTGLALLGAALVFLVVFGRHRHTPVSATVLTLTLLLGPLVVSGLALLLDWGAEGAEEAG